MTSGAGQRPNLRSASCLVTVTHKELRHIWRDPRTLVLVSLAPAVLLVILSYIFALDVGIIRVALRDLDRTRFSREFLSRLTADGDVVVVAEVESDEQAESLLLQSRVDALVDLPRGFTGDVLAGRGGEAHLLLDGTDAISARQALNELTQRLGRIATELAPARLGPAPGTVVVRERALYNAEVDSLVSMVPGMVAVVLCLPALALALGLTREKEGGAYEGLLATPVRGAEFVGGKFLAYASAGMVSVALATAVAVGWFGVPFRGRPADLMVVSAVFLFASMGVAAMVAGLTRTQQAAMFLILMVFFVPSLFVAGLILPVPSERAAELVAFLLPTSHFIKIVRGVFLKGLGLPDLWRPVSSLLLIGLVSHAVGLVLFRRKKL